jgi:hypothetical protein
MKLQLIFYFVYAQVQSIMDQIPASNVYILSDRHSAQQSGPASERQSTAYATAHVGFN